MSFAKTNFSQSLTHFVKKSAGYSLVFFVDFSCVLCGEMNFIVRSIPWLSFFAQYEFVEALIIKFNLQSISFLPKMWLNWVIFRNVLKNSLNKRGHSFDEKSYANKEATDQNSFKYFFVTSFLIRSKFFVGAVLWEKRRKNNFLFISVIVWAIEFVVTVSPYQIIYFLCERLKLTMRENQVFCSGMFWVVKIDIWTWICCRKQHNVSGCWYVQLNVNSSGRISTLNNTHRFG